MWSDSIHLTLDTPIDFAFSPRLSRLKLVGYLDLKYHNCFVASHFVIIEYYLFRVTRHLQNILSFHQVAPTIT